MKRLLENLASKWGYFCCHSLVLGSHRAVNEEDLKCGALDGVVTKCVSRRKF